ncbi:MAG: O-antigen polymerase [Pseudoclavibacter sp.]
MSTVLLISFLVFLLFIGSGIPKSSFVSPHVLLLVPFIVALIYGLLFYGFPVFTLSSQTCFLIAIGCAAFLLACIFAHILFRAKQGTYIPKNDPSPVALPSLFYILLLAFNCFTFILVYRSEAILVNQQGAQSGTLADTISSYNDLSKFGATDVALTGIPSYLFQVAYASCFVLGYLIAKQAMSDTKRFSWLCTITYLISSFGLLLIGSRSLTISSFVGLGIMFILIAIRQKKLPSLSKLPTRIVLPILLGAFAVVAAFFVFMPVIGRDLGTFSLREYIAVYLSAPLKNLDMYISSGYTSSSLFGQNTFTRLYDSLSKISTIDSSNLATIKQYQSFQGHFLGNVYSTFQAPLTDFGYLGAIVMVAIIGFVMQALYERALHGTHSTRIPYSVLFYGYLGYSLFYSFFSNMFYETVVSTGFLKFTVSLIIIKVVIHRFSSRSTHIRTPYTPDQPLKREDST